MTIYTRSYCKVYNIYLHPGLPYIDRLSGRKRTRSTCTIPLHLPNFRQEGYFAPSNFRNAVNNNYLADFLNRFGTSGLPTKVRTVDNMKPPNSQILESFFKWGNIFEEKVMSHLQSKFPDKCVTIAESFKDLYVREKHQQVENEMKRGTPFLFQVPLYDCENKTHGIADLLVRNDYLLNGLVDLDNQNPVYPAMLEYLNSKMAMQDDQKSTLGDYYYLVVDFKFSSMQLCSDGIHLRNSPKTRCNKLQVHVYNQSLKRLQGYVPNIAFLMGQWYNWTSGRTDFSINQPFKWLACVSIDDKLDSEIEQLFKHCHQWLTLLKDEGHSWTLYPEPCNDYLYPNPKAEHDKWHTVQQKYADHLDDITRLIYCTPTRRSHAFTEGIRKLSDIMDASQLGFREGTKLFYTVNQIININRQFKGKKVTYKCLARSLNSDISSLKSDPLWYKLQNSELFGLDLEFSNSLDVQWDNELHANYQNMVFLIGLSDINGNYQSWMVEREPIVQHIHLESEILENFLNYLESRQVQNYSFLHWGHAERTCFKKLALKYPDLAGKIDKYIIDKLVNLESLYRNYSIIIPGMKKFSLKHMIQIVNKHGWTNISYDNLNIANGEQLATSVNYDYSPSTRQDIKLYNKLDCDSVLSLASILQKIVYTV